LNISSLSNSSLFSMNQIAGSVSPTGNSIGTNGESSFGQMLNQKIDEVNSLQKDADQLTESFLEGGPVEIHQMLIAMEKADLALRETMEIRNKLIEAYKEIEKMQI